MYQNHQIYVFWPDHQLDRFFTICFFVKIIKIILSYAQNLQALKQFFSRHMPMKMFDLTCVLKRRELFYMSVVFFITIQKQYIFLARQGPFYHFAQGPKFYYMLNKKRSNTNNKIFYFEKNTSGKRPFSPGPRGPLVPVAQSGLKAQNFSPGCVTNRD